MTLFRAESQLEHYYTEYIIHRVSGLLCTYRDGFHYYLLFIQSMLSVNNYMSTPRGIIIFSNFFKIYRNIILFTYSKLFYELFKL